jgi:hypothetical protein
MMKKWQFFKRPSFVCALALSSITGTAIAQNKSSERILNTKTVQKRNLVKGASSGLSVILGGEYGIMKATPASKKDNSLKEGKVFELKALTGFLYKDFLIDSGLGWYSYKIRGQERLIRDTVEYIGDRELGVSGLLVEFSPSYRLTNNIFAGLVTQVRTPVQLDYFSEAKSAGVGFSAGAQLGLQLFNSELNSRFILKVLTNLGLKNWSDIQYLGGVQFGIPVTQPDSLVIRKTTVVNKVKDIIEYRKKDFTITVTSNVIKLALDNIVSFYNDGSGRPTLTPESQSFLVDLGNSLQSAISSWETLRIDAETPVHITVVRESLISTGVPSNKVKPGRSLKAVDDGGNISVDFTFSGVSDPRVLAESIRNAMSSMQIPESCQKGACE